MSILLARLGARPRLAVPESARLPATRLACALDDAHDAAVAAERPGKRVWRVAEQLLRGAQVPPPKPGRMLGQKPKWC